MGAWLVGCYALLSLAEILLAPLGVSLVTQLAPRHKTAQAVGLWFAGSATGNGLAAVLGLCWDRWPHHRYFAVLAAVSLAAAAPLLSRRRHLDWLTAHAADSASQPEAEDGLQAMTPTASPNAEPIAPPLAARAIDRPASLASHAAGGLADLLPASLIANVALPLPVRGVSAIVCGLAVLFCGPFCLLATCCCAGLSVAPPCQVGSTTMAKRYDQEALWDLLRYAIGLEHPALRDAPMSSSRKGAAPIRFHGPRPDRLPSRVRDIDRLTLDPKEVAATPSPIPPSAPLTPAACSGHRQHPFQRAVYST